MKVKVKPGWQLGIEGDKVYQPGEILNVPDALAQQWIAAGQATAAKEAVKKPPSKAVKSKAVKASKNKAVTSSANKAVSMPTMTPTVTAPPITVVSKP